MVTDTNESEEKCRDNKKNYTSKLERHLKVCHEVFTNVRQNSSDGDFIVIEFRKLTGKMSTQSQRQSEKSRLQTKELKKVYKEVFYLKIYLMLELFDSLLFKYQIFM